MNMQADTKKRNGDILRSRTHAGGADFASVYRFVMRRKWLCLVGFVVGIGMGAGLMVVTPPLYSASARIMLDTKGQTSGSLASEIEIIESTPVLSKVAGVLGLYRDSKFTNPSVYEQLAGGADSETALRDRVLARLAGMLDVRQIKDTGIIDMTVVNPDPDRAAQIANVVLSSYRERKMDERFEQSRLIGDWMAKHLDTIKAGLEQSKKKLEALESAAAGRAAGLLAAPSAADVSKALGALSHDAAQTSADIERMQRHLKGQPATVAPKNDAELRKLKTQLAILGKRYGDKHPKIIAIREKIAHIKRTGGTISNAGPETPEMLVGNIQAAEKKLAELQSRMDKLTQGYDAGGRMAFERTALESEISAGQRLYENFSIKYQDMMAEAELQDTGLKVVSMATIPSKPDEFKRMATVLALGCFGFMAVLFGLLGRALFNRGFTNANQLESMSGYPVFASVPGSRHKAAKVHHTVIENPVTVMAEAVRSLRVALRLRSVQGRGPRVVAFTSTLPDEGKTSLAVMLGMIAAKSGERVVIVDCDLRRPSLHKAFGIGNARGLQDYLAGNAGLDDVIYRKDPSGVHLVTTKAVPSYSLTLLTSGRMENFIEGLREQYDFVILDAPSSLAFADARVLARMVDQTMYVVAWNATRRDSALLSLKAYADMGYEDLALILNKVDLREYLRESAATAVYHYAEDQDGEGAAAPA